MPQNSISATFVTKGFREDMASIQKAEMRATMWGIRATGRLVAKEAKKGTPVYPGALNNSDHADPRALAEKGALRISIRNARRLEHVGDTYRLKVGPFGSKGSAKRIGLPNAKRQSTKSAPHAVGQLRGIWFYRRKIESLYDFMHKGQKVADSGEAKVIFEHAYDKGFKKAVGRK